MEALSAVIGREHPCGVGIPVGPPIAESLLDGGAIGRHGSHVGIGCRLFAESCLLQGRALFGIEEGGNHAEQMEGERTVAARAAWHVGEELLVGHERQQPDGCGHEPVEPRMEFGGREFRARFFLQAEKGHDLPRTLTEDELGTARQDRHRPCAQRLQLCEAGRIFEDIDGDEVDPTDR